MRPRKHDIWWVTSTGKDTKTTKNPNNFLEMINSFQEIHPGFFWFETFLSTSGSTLPEVCRPILRGPPILVPWTAISVEPRCYTTVLIFKAEPLGNLQKTTFGALSQSEIIFLGLLASKVEKRTWNFELGWLRGSNFNFSFMGDMHKSQRLRLILKLKSGVGDGILPNRHGMAWRDLTPCKEATVQFGNDLKSRSLRKNCHGRLDETLHVFCKALFCVYISIECPEFIHFRRPWKHCNHQQIRCISPALILECNVASGRRLFLTSLTCCRCVFQCGEWIMISSNPHVVKTSVQVIKCLGKMFQSFWDFHFPGKKELPCWRKGL